jgi:hypothetical protein
VTFLLALTWNLIADLAQVQLHRLHHLGASGRNSFVDFDHFSPVAPCVTFDGEVDCLYDREVDVGAVNRAFRIVDSHDGLGVLVRAIHVFLEVCLQRGEALAYAAAVCQLLLAYSLHVGLELHSFLADDQNLLGLQLLDA